MERENLLAIRELRHELHRHPELSGQEAGTIARLEAFLRERTSLTIVDRGGWFYAVKRGTSGGAPIAFRADMDALPMAEGIELPYASVNEGVAHKCGHDGHSAALCGLALELDRRDLRRTAVLIFQPAEETGAGAVRCRDLIREMGIAEIYAFHNISGYPEGAVLCRRGMTNPASEGLCVRFEGKPSHASAPEAGINPGRAIAKLALCAGEELAEACREFWPVSAAASSDSFDSSDPFGSFDPSGASGASGTAEESGRLALCTLVGMKCGEGDYGISAGEGWIRFTLRAGDEAVMKAMEAWLLARASALAAAEGLAVSHEIADYFPETRNHDEAVEKVLGTAAAKGFGTAVMREPWRASEDFGWFLGECPGALFYIGNGEDYPPVHTTPFDFNDRILETAVEMFVGLACGSCG